MPVTSSTVGGVNTWTFSGAVTDAEIKTAWAALIVNGVYVINRAIYLDSTADLTAVSGGFLVDFGTQVSPAFVLHNSRDKTKSTFNNFTFLQRTGLVVNQRGSFIQTTNGTTNANAGSGLSVDGLSLKGGGFVYGVVGNPGGSDPRFLNEMAYTSLDGVTIYSQEFTEQELQPCVGASTVMRGLTFEKAYGFPQIGTPAGSVNVVVYRSSQNTQSLEAGGLIPIRLFPANNRYAALCYVDSYVTRNGADITTRLINGFGSNATNQANVMILNNYTRESWFGASKTVMAITSWAATNLIFGGVLKKLRFVNGNGAVVRCYDSRSTTASQKCKFAETGFADFMDPDLAPTTDANGQISLVHIGAIASGGTAAIARYTNQKYTFQKFGYRVTVNTPDMTSGDNDLSAFTPVTLTTQPGLVRTQAEINAATTIATYRELLEELHVMAIGLVGEASYAGAHGGNHFDYTGSVLVTSFSAVNVDPAAAQKITYNATANTLTVKATSLAGGTAVSQWRNITGKINLLGGATIAGVYEDSDGQRATVTGLDPQAFGITWHLRYRLQGTTTWATTSGTGNTALILLTNGAYDVQVRAKGYEWESDLVLDTAVSLSLNAGLRFHVSANNTPQYTMAFDEALSNIFQYDATAMKVSVTNATAGILQPGFAELYRATQRIQHLPELVWTWMAPVTANATSQKILIPNGNPIGMFLTDASTNTVKITCPVTHADTGQSADDRVRGNASGYSIILGSPATAESAGLASQIISGLGGPDYESTEHGLSVIENLVQQVKTLNATIKGRTDLIPDAPAAVGSAMTLTGAYDAAKTAATQSSVDALTTATGTPLQASAYTAPANADIAAIKAKTDTLVNTDLSGVATQADAAALSTQIGTPLQASDYAAPPAPAAVASAVRTELATELGRIDVAVSTRSTLTAEDVPAGLTADQVWSHTTRTLTAGAGITAADVWEHSDRTLTQGTGLTSTQAVQLANIHTWTDALPTLDDIEGSTALAMQSTLLAVKAKTDVLANPDLSGLATSAQLAPLATTAQLQPLAKADQVQALAEAAGTPLQASDYTAPPTAATVATAVRTELATELGRIDTKVSTRLPATGYTAPDNAAIGQTKQLAIEIQTRVDAALGAPN